MYAKKIKEAEIKDDVIEIKDEKGNFYSVNTKENTILYGKKKGNYEIIENESTITLEYDGCTYSKTIIEGLTTAYAVSDNCFVKESYDFDTVESLMWAIEEVNDADFAKKYEKQVKKENGKNTFWAVVVSMLIIIMMAFVFFSSEDVDITE